MVVGKSKMQTPTTSVVQPQNVENISLREWLSSSLTYLGCICRSNVVSFRDDARETRLNGQESQDPPVAVGADLCDIGHAASLEFIWISEVEEVDILPHW